ncbi:L,D-transpeptidase [Thermomonas sp.]|uniref:L,D-transpeptidase family protein n=1 Tax=Thermomonas sp. TaxID=1971895 RepID=UPI00248A29DF|nr:L,D-transpeptidase [Thermomonas sp.]MDI1252204.1 L,D-transpeptidase [Thermomonas sp.]
MKLRLSTAIVIAITAMLATLPAFAQDVPAKDVPANSEPAIPATPVAVPEVTVTPELRAQILLERAWFSPGEIDGKWGSKSRMALAGFQQAHGLEMTETPDEASLAALDVDAAQVLVSYTISEADVAGPFLPTPAGPQAKSKMKSLPYQSAAEALGEKFHASPALLRALNPGVPLDVAGGILKMPNVQDLAPLAVAAKVVIDKSDSVLRLLDADGKAYAEFPITSGSSEFPLPIGEWKIESINPDPWYSYDPKLIVGANKNDPKALLPPGPNGPVGTMWMALSKPHYGIHGTPEPGLIGRTQSSGCVRLTNWSANAVSKAVSVGMTVSMQE